MIMRNEYMDADKLTDGVYDGSKGADLHHAYFSQYVNKWHIETVLQRIGADKLLASRDFHLNDIPLKMWDDLPMTAHIATKAKEFGDNTSLSTKVCVYKTAARIWLEENGGLPKWRIRYKYAGMPGERTHWLYSYAVGSDPESALVNFRAINPGPAQCDIIDAEGRPL